MEKKRNNYSMAKISGVDACIETSLFEYGIAWIESDKDILFYYGIDMNETEYNLFDFCAIDKDIDVLKEYDWVEFEDIYDFTGMNEEQWLEMPLTMQIRDLLSYYGYENIFGSSYWTGLKYNANINRFQTK